MLGTMVSCVLLLAGQSIARMRAEDDRRAVAERELAEARAADLLRMDVLEQAVEERTSQLRRAATHDKLTGLPNRALFNDRLVEAVARAAAPAGDVGRRTPYAFAVLFLDFDRFKVINDSLGHEYGDLLLVAIARRLEAAVRAAAGAAAGDPLTTVARLGGDEFCVLLGGAGEVADATAVADALLGAFDAPYLLRDREVHSTASIGITLSTLGYDRAEDLVRDADNAMYRAKSGGRNRYVVFDQQMHADALMRLTIESDLRRAVARGELTLLYQPIVRVEDGRMTGCEALVRWDHPQRGRMNPAEFIGLAEENGFIGELGRWVLLRAASQLAEWTRRFDEAATLTVSVNVSRRQLTPDFAQTVREAVRTTGVDPARLILEITESTLVSDPQATRAVLQELRDLGVGLYLDDFGTGYSSLSCITSFPLDGIKLDQSFIRESRGRRDRIALLSAIVTLARNLGLTHVAEGIETLDQVALLNAIGCTHGQGYLFSRPVAAEQIADQFRQTYRAAA